MEIKGVDQVTSIDIVDHQEITYMDQLLGSHGLEMQPLVYRGFLLVHMTT